MTPQRAYLIDASIYVFRAWYSIPDKMTTPKGDPVNAVYGFARMLLDFLGRTRPRYLGVAFDESLTTSFRNRLYPGYKASRETPPPELEQQFVWCRELTRALGIAEFASKEFEADDLIGSLAHALRQREIPVTVVSRDKDLAQTVRSGDSFWDFAAGKQYDYDALSERLGVAPARLADYQGLVGDAVDDIPGVRGIGPKAASILLQTFATLEEIYSNLERVAQLQVRGAARVRDLLEQHREVAFLSRELARIREDVNVCDVPEGIRRRAGDAHALDALFAELGFSAGLRRSAGHVTAP